MGLAPMPAARFVRLKCAGQVVVSPDPGRGKNPLGTHGPNWGNDAGLGGASFAPVPT
jgi:hypothetical protein